MPSGLSGNSWIVTFQVILYAWAGIGSCDIRIYNVKYICGLRPCFWTRIPKTLGISYMLKMVKVSVVMLIETFEPHLRMGSGCQQNIPHDYGWEFSVPPLTSTFQGEERGWIMSLITNGQWLNQSYLPTEACIKTQKERGFESLQVGAHVEIQGEQCTRRRHGSSLPFTPHPLHLFLLALPELYPFIINW